MKRLLPGLLWLVLAGTAFAADRTAGKRFEASMRVTGTIEVARDGTVAGYTLDRPQRIAPVVAGIIRKTVQHWSFEPVLLDGKPVIAKARMSLQLVAKPRADGQFEVGIRSAYFGEADKAIERDMNAQPRYPEAAIRARVQGTVFLVLRIDRAGKVDDAFAEQVNLRAIASDTRLKRWRRLFAEPSVATARRWRFAPATAEDRHPYRIVRVPVSYTLHQAGASEPDTYGQWIGYVPGPIEPAPWLDTDQLLTGGNGALPADGGVYGPPSLSLRTPLDRG